MSENVDALRGIIARRIEGSITGTPEQLMTVGAQWLAEGLAKSGVLAVDSLTDEDLALDLWDAGTRYETGEDHQDFAKPNVEGMRAALRRLATGAST